jgi:hypothetical protein
VEDAMESNRCCCTSVDEGPHVVLVGILVCAFCEGNVLKKSCGAILDQHTIDLKEVSNPKNPP